MPVLYANEWTLGGLLDCRFLPNHCGNATAEWRPMYLHLEGIISPFAADAATRSLLMVATSSPKPREPAASLDLFRAGIVEDAAPPSNPAADNLLLVETGAACDDADPLTLVALFSAPALL